MAYEKTVWVNGQAPALDAEHLNKIEQGIADAVSVTAQSLTDGQKTQARGNIGAAPDGYGIGSGIGKPITDANEAVLGGFYYWGSGVKNVPFEYGAMIVIPRSTTALSNPDVTQIASQDVDASSPLTYIAVRKSIDRATGVAWGEWEWFNPPMELGVEYRTTERYLGKPVYVKTVQAFSSLTGSDVTDVCEVPVDHAGKCISCTGETAENWSLPSDVIGGSSYHIYIGAVIFDANIIKIYARTNYPPNWSNAIRVTIKYTKTTN